MTLIHTPLGYGAFPYGSVPYGQGGAAGAAGCQVTVNRRFANRINPPDPNGQASPVGASQIVVVATQPNGTQVRIVNYNTNKLRVLCDFSSRGDNVIGVGTNAWGQFTGTGLNWIANHTETSPTNDFDVNNLNTDVVEQVWRSPSGSLATPSVLRVDTEVGGGVNFDTLGIFNSNLTTSATVSIEASVDAAFTLPIAITTLSGETDGNIIYVAQTLPLNNYPFYRLTVFDPTNPDGYLQLGTVVFGNAVIFSEQCFVDQVQWEPTHYTNNLPIEGQTTVQNDLGIKNKLRLAFRSWEFSSSDYGTMKDIFAYARTDLKCLWVPTPEYPKRFGIFGKMSSIPRETHNAKSEQADYVDFAVEVNEAK